MQVVVITGSTRGIGLGLAREFLKRGHTVVISGRSEAGIEQALADLGGPDTQDRLLGQCCDVRHYDQLQALWDAARSRFGRVDIWINNAGLRTPMAPFWEQAPQTMDRVVSTNVYGLMYGTQVAFQGMMAQGFGQIYNMEGYGSSSRKRGGMTIYGTTKYAVHYFSQAAIQEAQGTPVKIGTLSPGMVVTDLLMGGYPPDSEAQARAKRIFNILADRIETVGPFLVERMLSNTEHGTHIKWLTRSKIIWRFLSTRFRQRDLFAAEA